MDKIKVTLENFQSYSHDGTEWCLSPVRLEGNGKVLDEDDGKAFLKACVALGVLGSEYSRCVQYYNDNPVIYGVPDPTVTVGGVDLQVQDLVGEASDEEPYPTLTVEVVAPEGFSL